ncbi:MAG: hypothetical protein LBR62_02790, partial [Puniceicoccales bacterium]|nr:hypothetical protein [Puniceicoccales bacterium]
FKELECYDRRLRSKPHVIVGNKMDVEEASANLVIFKRSHPGELIFPVSCCSGQGLGELEKYFRRPTGPLPYQEEK